MTSLHSFHGFLSEDRIWCAIHKPAHAGDPRPALFLDRDGVIVEEVGYLCRAEDVKLIPGAAELIASANRLEIPVIVATNQAGIGRGYYGWPEFHNVEAAIAALLKARGAFLDATFACPYYPGGVMPYALDHPARKPGPRMLLDAASPLNLDLARSWIVGDKSSDLLAGRNAGLRGGLHVLTGHGRAHRDAAVALKSPRFDVRVGDSIRDAAELLQRISLPLLPESAGSP